MTKWAAKYFSHEDPVMQNQVWQSLPLNHSLELAAYEGSLGDFSPTMQAIIRNTPSFQKVLHHSHSLGISSLLTGEGVPKFESELLSCRRMDVSRSVMHVLSSAHQAVVQTHRLPPDVLFEEMLPFFRRANSQGVVVHIENVYETPEWFSQFYAVAECEHVPVGFCLDIGHARAFSKTSLDAWSPLLASLNDKGVSLHFHIHGNDGTKDMHLPLGKAEELGMLTPSDWAPEGLVQWLNKTTKAYPSAIFCLENKTSEVEDAFKWVVTHLR